MNKEISYISKEIHNLLFSKQIKVFIYFIIFADLISGILYSFNFHLRLDNLFQTITFVCSILFSIEYLSRIISSQEIYPSRNIFMAMFRYIFSFFGIIDLIVILPFILPLLLGGHNQEIFDLARIFLIFKLARYSKSFLMVIKIFHSIGKELLATFFFIGILICFFGSLMFYTEIKAQPEIFNNVGQGFWWAVITFTSVGYGDIVPITGFGKLLGAITALLGILMFAIPTGIISSAFMKYYAEKEKDKESDK